MRFRALVVAAGLLLALASLLATSAYAEEGYRHGRVRFVEPGVTLHRATEVSAEEALANLPFLPGDRVWTDGYGRAEFQFPDGTVLRLDARSKLDYAGHEEARDERIVLRLWSGSLVVRVRTRNAARFEIETPAGTVEALDQAMVRVDVGAGETRVSAYRGEALFDDGRERVRLSAGERAFSRGGEEPEEPRPFDLGEQDDFARWDEERESQERWAARSSEYLPAELDPYAGEFESHGSWRFEAAVGYVWTPRVSVGWSPYTNGHWSWTSYGWTWVPYETWGWAPFHYGRWGFSVGVGWYWAPGRVWGPGWVSWGVGGGYVGWCPLGYRDRPVYAWGGHNRGHAVPRHGGHGGWNVVREGDFGHRDVARRRMPLAGIDPGALQVAESPSLRPTRNGRSLVAANPTARASRRPTPGDFVRELSVDNKTTIPSPWRQRGRAMRDGAGARETREPAARARPRGGVRDTTAEGRAAPDGGAASESKERFAARPRASRPAPWNAPRSDVRPRREDAERSSGASPPGANAAPRAYRFTRPRRDDGEAQRPRRDDGEAQRPRREHGERPSYRREAPRDVERAEPRGGAYRNQDDSPRSRPEAGGQRARPEAGASRAPRETASPRTSGDGGRSRGGGGDGGGGGAVRSAPRPPRERR